MARMMVMTVVRGESEGEDSDENEDEGVLTVRVVDEDASLSSR